jgi:hypothetical protein
MTKFKIFVCLLALLSANTAQACRAVQLEVRTFLTALPKDAMSRDIVAKVKILTTEIREDEDVPVKLSRVEVIEPLKGTSRHQMLNVLSQIHSCTRDSEVAAGETYFIAGALNASGVFEGSWHGLIPNHME